MDRYWGKTGNATKFKSKHLESFEKLSPDPPPNIKFIREEEIRICIIYDLWAKKFMNEKFKDHFILKQKNPDHKICNKLIFFLN